MVPHLLWDSPSKGPVNRTLKLPKDEGESSGFGGFRGFGFTAYGGLGSERASKRLGSSSESGI